MPPSQLKKKEEKRDSKNGGRELCRQIGGLKSPVRVGEMVKNTQSFAGSRNGRWGRTKLAMKNYPSGEIIL